MKTLFDETKIHNMQLRNRFIRSATWEGMADCNGRITKRLFQVYEALADGGVGLIITSATCFMKAATRLPGMMSLADDALIQDFRDLADTVHARGCPIILQLAFSGRDGEMWTPASPSARDIQEIVKGFGEGARRAKAAGFDGVQIHAAHGYFLSQFLQPQTNTRQDQYGGSAENRVRILEEIYDEIRSQTGKNYTIFIKINGTDAVNEAQGFASCQYACNALTDRGIDAIEISGGDAELKKNLNHPHQESVFRNYAAAIAAEIRVPVILVGYNRTPAVMNEILNTDNVEYFALARPLLREPNLVNEWKNNNNKKAECISCNACFKQDGNTCIFV